MTTGHTRKRSFQDDAIDLPHKRKCIFSLQDHPIDLTMVKTAVHQLNELQEELDGIQETEEEMAAIMEHMDALYDILDSAKNRKIAFSAVRESDLTKLGVSPGRLVLKREALMKRAEAIPAVVLDELQTRILEIYEHVNMDYDAGARMILDAILLALPKVVDRSNNADIAIMPGMQLTRGMQLTHTNGVQITNPKTGFRLRLTGSVDYAVIKYQNDANEENKALLLGSGGDRRGAFEIADRRLLLVQAKRENLDRIGLSYYLPEATSQAMAVIKATQSSQLRYCLSNGTTWIFCLLKYEDDQWTYYVSGPRQLKDPSMTLDQSLRMILQLVLEWLDSSNSNDDLYTLLEFKEPL